MDVTATPRTATGPLATTPAMAQVIATLRQQLDLGHTAEKDDALGCGALTRMARQKLLRAEQDYARRAERELQKATDMAAGNVRQLTPRERDVLYRRLAAGAALAIAAMETLDRLPVDDPTPDFSTANTGE